MAHFWDILIGTDSTYSSSESRAAIVSSRSMVHFIERSIVGLKFKADFYRLCISCSKEPIETEFWIGRDPAIATINLQIDLGDFLKSESAMHDAFERVIRLGFNRASQYVSLPIAEVNAALDEFINEGYKSRWVHADKTWKRLGVRVVIECDHHVDRFDLKQRIYKDNELLFDEVIATELPREWLFHGILGKLTLRDKTIVYEKGKSIISKYDLSEQIMTERPS